MDKEKQIEQPQSAPKNDVKLAPASLPVPPLEMVEVEPDHDATGVSETSHPGVTPTVTMAPVNTTKAFSKPQKIKQPKIKQPNDHGPTVMIALSAVVFVVLCGLAFYAYSKK
jgi:hypothetical protein